MDVNDPINFNLETICECGDLPDDFRKFIIESQKIAVFIQILPEIFHKLKNKMTPIMGYAQLLSLKAEDQNIRERLSRIEKNTEELGSLLDQLGGYFQNGTVVRFKSNINDILAEMEPGFREIEKQRRVKIQIDKDLNIADDYLNIGQIEALMSNIVENAVLSIEKRDAAIADIDGPQPESGFIQITTRSGDGHYSITVRDNGVGIAKESLAKVWIPFYSEFDRRAGLGLLLCEKVVRNHKASIRLDSHEGSGTEVEITFKHKNIGRP